jgi:hypothetical protein
MSDFSRIELVDIVRKTPPSGGVDRNTPNLRKVRELPEES